MVFSLGRTLYNLAAGRAPVVDVQRSARPSGDLVWLHAPSGDALSGLSRLARRIESEMQAKVLLTCPEGIALPARQLRDAAPFDRPAEVRSFLQHWQPRLVIFAEGELRPALIAEAKARGIPMWMVNARDPVLLRERDGWYPGLVRSCLAAQQRVFAIDAAGARAFRRAGAAEVVALGRLEEPSAALPHHEPERAALAALLATRPIWLAVGLPEAEEAAVIAAHRAALRLSHRLLLILVPQDFARAELLVAQMESTEGWSVAQRRLEQEPDSEVTVYIPDSDNEYGLWYRLAPVCYLGGSLSGQGCARNPMEAAAMGSAIIYGPKPGLYGGIFGRLGAAQAGRAIGDAADLGEALSDLLAPDRAARLAQAAWALSSDGSEASERVFQDLRSLIGGAG